MVMKSGREVQIINGPKISNRFQKENRKEQVRKVVFDLSNSAFQARGLDVSESICERTDVSLRILLSSPRTFDFCHFVWLCCSPSKDSIQAVALVAF
eukprot:g10977.t1